jgi:excisionase family DNA binding protein
MNAAARVVPRIALTPDEAANSIGVGRSLFYEQILPELRVIRVGRKRLIPVRELETWSDRNAARTL